MSLFPRLDRALRGTRGNIVASSPVFGEDYEQSATAHWRFGADNPLMQDLRGRNALTPRGAAPVISKSFLSTVAGQANGLDLPFPDKLGFGLILFVRAKITGNRQCIVGCSGSTANAGIAFINIPGNTGGFAFADFYGNGGNYQQHACSQPSGLVDNVWIALIMGDRQGAGSWRYYSAIGGQSFNDSPAPNNAGSSLVAKYYRPKKAGNLTIGPPVPDGGTSYTDTISAAAAIYWDTQQQPVDMLDAYVREKTALASRGIVVL